MDPAVAGIIVAAVVSLLIYTMRTALAWGLGKRAIEQGASVKISGLNPLAPTVEVKSNGLDQTQASGPSDAPARRTRGRASKTSVAPDSVQQLKRVPEAPAA